MKPLVKDSRSFRLVACIVGFWIMGVCPNVHSAVSDDTESARAAEMWSLPRRYPSAQTVSSDQVPVAPPDLFSHKPQITPLGTLPVEIANPPLVDDPSVRLYEEHIQVAFNPMDLIPGRRNPRDVSGGPLKENRLKALEYNTLGNSYEEEGFYDRAAEQYKKAIEMDSESAIYHSNLGNIYSRQKNYSEAIRSYKRAILLDPEAAYAHNNLGNTYYGLGQYNAAIKEYKISAALNPKLAYVHNNLGDAYLRKNLPNLAIRHFNKAISLDKKYALAYRNVAEAYQKKKEWAFAIGAYEKAISLEPKNYETVLKYGLLYLQMGDPLKAKSTLERVMIEATDARLIEEARQALSQLEKPSMESIP